MLMRRPPINQPTTKPSKWEIFASDLNIQEKTRNEEKFKNKKKFISILSKSQS